MMLFIILLLAIASPAIVWGLFTLFHNKDRKFDKCNNKIILNSKNKLTVKTGNQTSYYLYQDSTSYGDPQSLERSFIGNKYVETNRIKLNVYDAMQDRINQLQEEDPNVEVDVLFFEKGNKTK